MEHRLNKTFIPPKEIDNKVSDDDDISYKNVDDPTARFEPKVFKSDFAIVARYCDPSSNIKLLVLSDIHGCWNSNDIIETIQNENIDAFIYAGDIINHDNDVVKEIDASLKAIRVIGSVVPTFIIAGNHDEWVKWFTREELDARMSPAHYIENECFTFKNIRFFGTPMAAAETKDKIGNFMRYHPKKINPFGNIPSDVEVIISHGGPIGMNSFLGVQYGDENLRELIENQALSPSTLSSPKLIACLFGHIHNNAGFRILNDVICLNASQIDGYSFRYRPFILNIRH